jgi:two-component system chemotaxis response regulator CheY
MNSSAIRLLHIDDDRIQQAMVAHALDKLGEYQFSIRTATSEEEAIRSFLEGGIDLVILDYHLSKGDGLSCLRRLRQNDPFVPIIAVSGVATTEIATQLIEEGADDYLCKQSLNFGQSLTQSVRNVLTRAKVLRGRFLSANTSPSRTAHCALTSPTSSYDI